MFHKTGSQHQRKEKSLKMFYNIDRCLKTLSKAVRYPKISQYAAKTILFQNYEYKCKENFHETVLKRTNYDRSVLPRASEKKFNNHRSLLLRRG